MAEMVLDRGEVSLYYEVHGTGTGGLPLLLTHGFGASSSMWTPNVGALSASRTVITWDIRGHGRTVTPPADEHYTEVSTVADMAAILDACGIGRAAIGGLSLGGYLSLAFHLAHPERVDALLLFDTGPGYKSDEGRQRWNDYSLSRARAFQEQGMTALSDTPETAFGPHDAAGLARAARGILTQRDASVINSLGRITVPALVLVGEHDRAFLAATDYMASHIPGARKVVVAGAGHAANVDRPEEFNEAVSSFLAEI